MSQSDEYDMFLPVTMCYAMLVGGEIYYISMVTGTHYGTKTPPIQQPTNPCTRDMTRGIGYFTMDYKHGLRVRCLVGSMAWGRLVVMTGFLRSVIGAEVDGLGGPGSVDVGDESGL